MKLEADPFHFNNSTNPISPSSSPSPSFPKRFTESKSQSWWPFCWPVLIFFSCRKTRGILSSFTSLSILLSVCYLLISILLLLPLLNFFFFFFYPLNCMNCIVFVDKLTLQCQWQGQRSVLFLISLLSLSLFENPFTHTQKALLPAVTIVHVTHGHRFPCESDQLGPKDSSKTGTQFKL